MLLRVGWLARIPLCFWAHTDLTDPTVLLCGWEISQMLLRVWTCVGSDGGTLLSLSRIYLSDPSDPSDKSDLSDLLDKSDGLDILKKIREICEICVRPWRDMCEAGDKITKNCVIWGGVLKDLKKSVEKVATLRKFCKLCVLNTKSG